MRISKDVEMEHNAIDIDGNEKAIRGMSLSNAMQFDETLVLRLTRRGKSARERAKAKPD